MPRPVRLALLPLLIVLPFVMTPAQAISTASGASAAASPVAGAQLTKKQLKQQRKLAKQCAKLAAGKIKKASKRAKYQALCARPTDSAPPVTEGGAGPVVGEDQDTTGGSPGAHDTGAGADSGGSGGTTGGGSNAGGPAQDYLDELLDLPPIFTPPAGGAEQGSGDVPQTPVLDVVTPVNDVPEPGSLALLGLGLLGLGLARRRAR
jgi:hypothetical protein